MTIIDLQNVYKVFGLGDATTIALDDINLRIEAGEFVAVMGPSGSGKSTLMHIIGLLDRPTQGLYKLDGKDITRVRSRRRSKLRRDRIGFVFQSFNLLTRATVLDNVALPLAYRGVRTVKRQKRAADMLETVGLHSKQYYMPHQLSGGQLQRAAIARALINNPSLIIADEPTGNLDSAASEQIMQLLKELNQSGHTILMVTHNQDLTRYASRIIYLRDGRIQHDQNLKADEAVDINNIQAAREYAESLKKHSQSSKTRGRKKKKS